MKEEIRLVTVNMGYGHQRTAFPLKSLAFGGKIIYANNYPEIPEKDRKIWKTTREGYEFISTFYRIPFVGKAAFSLFDRFQKIFSFYPKRDLSKPNFQLKQIFSFMKKGWGRDFIERMKAENKELKTDLPLVSTFFVPTFMAEYFNYPGDIYCVICDADISRTWVSINPKTSRIKYFAPNMRVVERLKLYGVKEKNIFLTGFPLPQEIIGGENMEILKEDLKQRLLNLDPQKKYFEKYKVLVEASLGKLPEKSGRPLTIMFSVGGAGAQKEIGIKIIKSLSSEIKKGKIEVVLAAGIKKRIKKYFEKNSHGLVSEIIFSQDIKDYFQKFNQALKKTDILWTKPSELSFYAALGLPIIIAPPIGSQEEFNKRWLLKSGFGFLQEDPAHLNQWLFDWQNHGYLAEAAMQGFIEGEKLGTLKIKKICCG